MDRSKWLQEKRRWTEEQETRDAPNYDAGWGDIAPSHQKYFERFLELCPAQGRILDAACGTGKYWGLIRASGREVFGIDQSQGVLDCAREKFPEVSSVKVGLQELNYQAAFAGAACMDALELVCPEDWPICLGNLQRAIEPGGHLYFTVETAAEGEIEQAFREGQQLGLPVVYGEAEWIGEEGYHWEQNGYYHYYPKIEQVKEWIQQAGLRLIDDDAGDGYHHFLTQRP